MKKKCILLAYFFATLIAVQAADIYYYQSQFTSQIEAFKSGFTTSEDFDRSILSLAQLQKGLADETDIRKKEPLLSEIRAVWAFVGEISPDIKSYYLTLEQKDVAIELLDLRETIHSTTEFCLPITKMVLWDSTYTCYMINNPSDSMMVNYRIELDVRKIYSLLTGFIDAGISKQSSRVIFSGFGNLGKMTFKQEKCQGERQMAQYIVGQVVQPEVEEYAEPDYYSSAEKKAMKQKEQERLRKQREKEKKASTREREKQKKEQLKARNEARKIAEKERAAAKKAMEKERAARRR